MTIGEVARQTGISCSAIRFYEREGLLPPPGRRSGRRVYDRSALGLLALISKAKRAGFSLSEIRVLLHGFSRGTSPPDRWSPLIDAKRMQLDAQIRGLRGMQAVLDRLMNCECATLEECGVRMLASSERSLGSTG